MIPILLAGAALAGKALTGIAIHNSHGRATEMVMEDVLLSAIKGVSLEAHARDAVDIESDIDDALSADPSMRTHTFLTIAGRNHFPFDDVRNFAVYAASTHEDDLGMYGVFLDGKKDSFRLGHLLTTKPSPRLYTLRLSAEQRLREKEIRMFGDYMSKARISDTMSRLIDLVQPHVDASTDRPLDAATPRVDMAISSKKLQELILKEFGFKVPADLLKRKHTPNLGMVASLVDFCQSLRKA